MSVNTFLTAVADYLALISARYQKYRADETAKSRAQAQQAQMNAVSQFYTEYGWMLVECVANNFSSCGLCRPGTLPQHLVLPGQNIRFHSRYGPCFLYEFDRGVDVSNGGSMRNMLEGTITYSTVPTQHMQQKLNAVLPNYCIAKGITPVKIIAAKDMGNGRVRFAVAPY